MKWNIKTIGKEILTAAVLLFIVSNVISYLRKPSLDFTDLPMIEAKLLDGTRYKRLEGKPLVIHFWADWCKVCKMEASNIESLSKKYEVLTIAVNSGDDHALQAYMKERNLHFRVINDREGKWAEKFKVSVFPSTFIYNSEGELKFTEVGYTTTAGLMARLALVK